MRRASIEINAGDNVVCAWSGGAKPLLETLTPNNTSPYVTSTTDLRKGPMVLEIDRTSCESFWANQLRVLLTATAYVLFQELRWRAARHSGQRLSVGTLRLRLIKIGARIERSVRRIVVHLAESHPWRSDWCQLAAACGASPG